MSKTIKFNRRVAFWRCARGRTFIWSGFAAAIALPSIAAAAEQRELDAHVHGAAELRIVAEDNRLVAELETPMMNVVGFEREPRSSEEQETYESAVSLLGNSGAIFEFRGTECSSLDVAIEEPEFHAHDHDEDHDHGDEHDHDDDHHHDDDHDHDDEQDHGDDHHHDDDHGDEHDHAHAHDDGEDAHFEIHATYEFECDDLNSLESIRVNLFDSFSGMEEIDAFYIGDRTFTAELTSSDAEISLR